jgi:3-oxoadipate enol-lactonase
MPSAAVGDAELEYWDDGTGDETVLLIHGLAGDSSAWSVMRRSLAGRFRVVGFDNRGAGRSTQSPGAVTTELLARDSLSLMDHLGVDRAQIVGRSMGGAIAQQIALIAPERVQSLVMCSSFARLDPRGRRALENMREALEWSGSWEVHARHSVGNFISTRTFNESPQLVKAVERIAQTDYRLIDCYVAQNQACQEHDTLARLGEIACPVLIAAGGRDPVCSMTATRWMANAFVSPEVVIFEESSHLFLLEEEERAHTVVIDWLEKNRKTADNVSQSWG